MRQTVLIMMLLIGSVSVYSQNISITVDAQQDRKPISPYIYGKNNNISDEPGKAPTAAEYARMREAGLRFTRDFGGNNGTKYNWRRKLSSHPDWYNNVYPHDWDNTAKLMLTNLPGVQGMWSFQLIGYAAKSDTANFDAGKYNNYQWWKGVAQNLAGGGVVNSTDSDKALKDGDTTHYLERWTSDSTVGILDQWFNKAKLGLDSTHIKYWSMDNEPEIWSGTHDDVVTSALTAEDFMQRYFAVAKKARAQYPGIKLCGPVPGNEWQWYSWQNQKISYSGKSYTWLEYFILRCAEEQTKSGIRLLDVLDIHFYPTDEASSDLVQVHRVFFDKTFNYPKANGVKVTAASGWDNSLQKEYIFERCKQWLTTHMGSNHGVKLAVSEFGAKHNSASVSAVMYASILGTFANNEVELFSPWTWNVGMWEVMHLFSRYAQTTSVQSISSNESLVSAYSSVTADNDSLTIIFVNRSLTEAQTTHVAVTNIAVENGWYEAKTLANLPVAESFVSHSKNALQLSKVKAENNGLDITLPALSVTAVVISKNTVSQTSVNELKGELNVYPTPFTNEVQVSAPYEIEGVALFDQLGNCLKKETVGACSHTINTESLPQGVYYVKAFSGSETVVTRIVK